MNIFRKTQDSNVVVVCKFKLKKRDNSNELLIKLADKFDFLVLPLSSLSGSITSIFFDVK